MITYYVVQSFQKSAKGRIIADQPQQLKTEGEAVRVAKRLAGTRSFVIAFSRTGDETTGDYGDAVILAKHGAMPEGFEEAIAA